MGGETKQNWLIAVLEIILADSAFIFLINILIRVARFVRDSIVKYLLFANYRSRLISYKVYLMRGGGGVVLFTSGEVG